INRHAPIIRVELRESLESFNFFRMPFARGEFAKRTSAETKNRRNAEERRFVKFAIPHSANRFRADARLFSQFRIGNAQPALRFSNDVTYVVFKRNHGTGISQILISCGSAEVRNSEIRFSTNFSSDAATLATEKVLPVSFSIDVIATLSMPQGTIRLKGERSPQTFNANPCIVIQWRTPTPIDAILRSSTQTPVSDSRRIAATSYSVSVSMSSRSSQRKYLCKSCPQRRRSIIG